jgi:alkylation response protein AidB-like acyl-CoA dehydrogenase
MRDIPRTIFADEHDQFRSAFRGWLDNAVVPNHEQWEHDQITPRELWLEAGKHGFLGLSVPETYGGGGSDDYRFGAIMTEEIGATGVIGSGNGVTLHNDIVVPYLLMLCTAMAARHVHGRDHRCAGNHRTEHR